MFGRRRLNTDWQIFSKCYSGIYNHTIVVNHMKQCSVMCTCYCFSSCSGRKFWVCNYTNKILSECETPLHLGGMKMLKKATMIGEKYNCFLENDSWSKKFKEN